MIVMKLMGGMGNQMFQYAFSRELAELYDEDVYYDFESYDQDKLRKLELYNLNVPELKDWKDAVSPGDRKKIKRIEKIYHAIQLGMRILHRSDRVGEELFRRFSKNGYYFNFDPYFYPIVRNDNEIKVAYGYFQGEQYFQNVVKEVKKSFQITRPVAEERQMLDSILSSNSVCVHVRAGDYKARKNRRFNVLTKEYFQRGIEYVKARVHDPVFYVFTNDVETVKECYELKDVNYVFGFKDYQDMRLMLACRHFIISNSTFSWWTSYLADSPDKIVVVPEKWRNNQEASPALMNSQDIHYVML